MSIRRFIVDSSGTARQILRRFVVDSGGTARMILRRFVVDSGGVSRLTFVGAVFGFPTGAFDIGAFGINTIIASITFNTNGTWTQQGTNLGSQGSGNWIDPTSLAPGGYTIRAHVDSGPSLTAGAEDTDLDLSSQRTFALEALGPGSETSSLTLTIKDSGGNTVATVSSIDLSVTA